MHNGFSKANTILAILAKTYFFMIDLKKFFFNMEDILFRRVLEVEI